MHHTTGVSYNMWENELFGGSLRSPSTFLLVWVPFIVLLNYCRTFTVKEIPAGDDEEGTSGQPLSKRLKVEPEKKKEKRHKVDEDEIQKMQ